MIPKPIKIDCNLDAKPLGDRLCGGLRVCLRPGAGIACRRIGFPLGVKLRLLR
jgi:hypothetical protein